MSELTSYFIPDPIGAARLLEELETAIENDALHPIEGQLEKFLQSRIGDDRQVTFLVSGGKSYYLKPIKENPTGWIVIAQED